MKCFDKAKSRKSRVGPSAERSANYDVIEARPKRFIRVHHENVRKAEVATTDIDSGDTTLLQPERSLDYAAPSLKQPNGSRNPKDWVLFFVHGVGSSSRDWSAQIDHFKKLGYRIVAVDLIGHGGSRPLPSSPSSPASLVEEDFSFKQMASDVLAVFDHYADGRGNVLIGHSLGCSICTYVESKRPYAVSKMSLLCGGGPDVLNARTDGRGGGGGCGCGCCDCCCDILSLPNCFFSLFRPCCYSYVKKQMFSQSHLKSTQHLHTSLDDVSPDVIKYTLKGQVWMEANEAFHEALRIHCQLIGGTEDQLVDGDDEVRMFQTLRLCRLDMIIGGSHMLMIENAAIVNSLLQQFILEPILDEADFAKFNFPSDSKDVQLEEQVKKANSEIVRKSVLFHKDR